MRMLTTIPTEPRFSMGWKTTLMVVLPMILGMLAAAWLVTSILAKESRQSIRQLMTQELLGLDREFSFMEKEVERLAVNPILINALADPKLRQTTLPELIQRFATGLSAKAFVLTDPEGTMIFSHLEPLPQYQELPNLKAALATGRTTSHLDFAKNVFLVATPVRYFKIIQGIVIYGFDVEAIINRWNIAGGQRRLVAEKENLGKSQGNMGGLNWVAATAQTPILYRFGVTLEAKMEGSQMERVILKSAGFVLILGFGLTLMMWLLLSRAVSQSVKEALNTFERTIRPGRVRALAIGPIPPKKSIAEPKKTKTDETVDLPNENIEDHRHEPTPEMADRHETATMVIDALPMRIFWKNRDGVYQGYNQAFAQDAGLHENGCENLRDLDMPWKKIATELHHGEQKIMEGESSLDQREWTLTTASGASLTVELSRVPLKDDAGQIIGILGVYAQERTDSEKVERRDQTLRRYKNMEKRLQQFSEVVHYSPSMVLIANTHGNISYVNESFCTTLDTEPGDVLGQTHPLLNSGLKGTDGGIWHGEMCIPRKDGETVWVSTMVAPIFSAEGKIENYFSLSENIQWRKILEQRLETTEVQLESMLQVMGEGFWEWDLTTERMIFSPRWWGMFGLEALAGEKPEETWQERVHPEDWDIVEGLIQVHLSGAEDVYISQHRMRHADGDWLWVLERGRISVWDEQGTPLRMVCSVLDVTQKKTLESIATEATSSAKVDEPPAAEPPKSPEHEVVHVSSEDRFVAVLKWPEGVGLDVASGLEHVGGDALLYRHLLVGFYEKNQDLTKRLQEMLVKSRYDRIDKEIQGIREVLFELGALKLHDQVVALEGILTSTPRRKETIVRYFEPFCQSLDEWIVALRAWMGHETRGDDDSTS